MIKELLSQSCFTEEFRKLNVNEIVRSINEKGYFDFENALTEEFVSRVELDSTACRLNLNSNQITGVYAEKQYYLNNLLCISKAFYDYVTSQLVFNICKGYLGDTFRLKALRYYETYGGHHMQWHTDNKTDRGFAHIPGLIFIFYVSDVYEGEFQYVQGSHIWSGEKAYSDYTDEFINSNYSDKIISFRRKKGALIIYNTYGIHRARPVLRKDFVRKSVFFQVDSEIDNSEPILVNTAYINSKGDDISMFLGFGRRSDYEVFPRTALNTLEVNKDVVVKIVKYFFYRMYLKVNNFLKS